MVKKIYFPREVLPFAYVTSQFANMLFSFIVVFIVLIMSGMGIGVAVVWLPAVMIIQYVLCLGITRLTSAVTVYLRDLQQILSVFFLALMYASPVIYPVSMVPKNIKDIYMLNPMSALVVAYRDILYYQRAPEGNNLVIAFGISSAILGIGFYMFFKLKRRFVEEL